MTAHVCTKPDHECTHAETDLGGNLYYCSIAFGLLPRKIEESYNCGFAVREEDYIYEFIKKLWKKKLPTIEIAKHLYHLKMNFRTICQIINKREHLSSNFLVKEVRKVKEKIYRDLGLKSLDSFIKKN